MKLKVFGIYEPYKSQFLLVLYELVALSFYAGIVDVGLILGGKSERGSASEPAPCLRKLIDIIPYALRNDLALKLGERSGYCHHHLTRYCRGVEALVC